MDSASTTGVIFDVERDTFKILDQMGAVRSLKPSQIGIKADSMRAVATDRDGYNIEKDDMMQEVGAGVSFYFPSFLSDAY